MRMPKSGNYAHVSSRTAAECARKRSSADCRLEGAVPHDASSRPDATQERSARTLQLLQHRLRVGDFELAGRLDVDLLHHAIVHDHREALAARAHAAAVEVELEAELLRVVGAAVGEEADLAAGLLVARPRAHH